MKKAAGSKFQKLRLHLFPDKAKGHDLEKTMSFVAVLFNFSQHQTLAHAKNIDFIAFFNVFLCQRTIFQVFSICSRIAPSCQKICQFVRAIFDLVPVNIKTVFSSDFVTGIFQKAYIFSKVERLTAPGLDGKLNL